MLNGVCDGMFLRDDSFKNRVISGKYNKEECERVDAGTVQPDKMDDIEEGAVCKRDSSGKPDTKFDCDYFKRVGTSLLSVPLSMPISPSLAQRYGYRVQCPLFLQHLACVGLK